MYAYDVNGDGLNDVITSIEAHGYGLVWYEQFRENGEINFKQHVITGKKPEDNRYGVCFSQPHAIDLIDMDGDGLKDIVTGKRFWAHGAHGDADPSSPAVLYWFKLVRLGGAQFRNVLAAHGAELLMRPFPQLKQITKAKDIDFVPYLIDDNSGIGTQVLAGDINGDKLPDVVVGNKKGTFVFIHEKKKASKADWEKAQPKPIAVRTAAQ